MELETITLIEQPCIVCSEQGTENPVSTALKEQGNNALVVYLCDEHRTSENYQRYAEGES